MISICMAYYNRKLQLYKTLETIAESKIKDYEVVIVDDGSSKHHLLDKNELISKFGSNIVLITIPVEEKNHINSCVAYNMAFEAARYDKIVIQNPECLHATDILSDVAEHLESDSYFAYPVFGMNPFDTMTMSTLSPRDRIRKFISKCSNGVKKGRRDAARFEKCWFVHPKYFPKYYHYLTAITRSDLDKVGGFNEEFAHGVGYDDQDFLTRVHQAEISILPRDWHLAAHQYHEHIMADLSDEQKVGRRNFKIYQRTLGCRNTRL